MFIYQCTSFMLLNAILFSNTFARSNIEVDCTDNMIKHLCDESADSNMFIGNSSCEQNITQSLEGVINTLIAQQNKTLEGWDTSIKRVTANVETLERKIDTTVWNGPIGKVTAKLETLERTIDTIGWNESMKRVTAKVESMERKIDTTIWDELLRKVTAKLETLERKIGTIGWEESIKRVNAHLESMEKKIFNKGNGYEYYQPDKFWYKLYNDCKSWSDARQVCQQDGGDLISLNVNNFDFFRNVARSKAVLGKCEDFRRHIWVGATDVPSEGEWYWLNGERVSRYGLWEKGEPSNNNRNEHCGDLFSLYQFRLNDNMCSLKQHFLCQII